MMTTATTRRWEKRVEIRLRQYASRRATSPVRSTRTPCQQIEARTNSLGADTHTHDRARTRTRRQLCTTWKSFVRESEIETLSTHTTPLTNPRASRAGEFLLRHRTAPSRNLAYARLSSPTTAVSSTRSTLHCRATPHRDVGSNRATARCTPAQTKEQMLASLARPRLTERTTEPTTTEPSRAESKSSPKSCALHNFP